MMFLSCLCHGNSEKSATSCIKNWRNLPSHEFDYIIVTLPGNYVLKCRLTISITIADPEISEQECGIHVILGSRAYFDTSSRIPYGFVEKKETRIHIINIAIYNESMYMYIYIKQ